VEDEEYETRSMRFMPCDIAPLVFGLIENVLGAVHASSITIYNVAARHANFKHEQAVFYEEASIELETLTGENDG
jgi:hypothetical protein